MAGGLESHSRRAGIPSGEIAGRGGFDRFGIGLGSRFAVFWSGYPALLRSRRRGLGFGLLYCWLLCRGLRCDDLFTTGLVRDVPIRSPARGGWGRDGRPRVVLEGDLARLLLGRGRSRVRDRRRRGPRIVGWRGGRRTE